MVNVDAEAFESLYVSDSKGSEFKMKFNYGGKFLLLLW